MDDLRNEQIETADAPPGECAPGQQTEGLAEALAACEEKHLRLRAEYDNFRKRSQKERESVYAFALAEAVGGFIPVLDNLERACAAREADDGVKMIAKQLTDILEKLGVRPLGVRGEGFDPNLHNAVAHEGEGGGAESVISEVLQKGYILGDKLIRPAMVKTADDLEKQ